MLVAISHHHSIQESIHPTKIVSGTSKAEKILKFNSDSKTFSYKLRLIQTMLLFMIALTPTLN
jgi:hypothetical protein